ncbi:hypothetical protein LJR289_002547 [Pseudoduganella sp. LjRoot289]|uniref:hypothetical protein n=1 Tax=Pseudoduganella sp. LjRoot289 TaxID=3342314 RepID=UPI003ED07214
MDNVNIRKHVSNLLVASAVMAVLPCYAAAKPADKSERPSWLLGALSIVVAIAVRRKTVNTDV